MPRCVCQAGSDLLYIMGYDTRAQIFGRCIASANSPPAGEPSASFRKCRLEASNPERLLTAALEHGARRFLARGVPAHKLVLGVPFYGYAYPCLNSGVTDDVCAIPRTAWRGVNCRCDQNAFRRRGVLGAVKTKRLLGRSEVAGDEVQ
eukprot:COSAG04_NODE_12348_length_657_cov_0.824373_1_plen_147_part_10